MNVASNAAMPGHHILSSVFQRPGVSLPQRDDSILDAVQHISKGD
jgi:hypothetical protein